MTDNYDLIVVGGGSAGLTAAGIATQLGVRVALIEKDRLGGDCTWTGCVPSKALLKAARVAHDMRNARRYGLAPADPRVDLAAIMARIRDTVGQIYADESPDALRARGIDVLLGPARFRDPHTLAVGQETLTARKILIATGARPLVPPINGLDEVGYLSSDNLWDLEALPEHLLIVGAGPMGCEMAQAFRRLGARVTLLVAGDRLLPRDDPAASLALAEVFTAEGIDLIYNARAELAWHDEAGRIRLGAGGNGLVGDTLLLAAGRRPNVDGLGLARAGVAYSPAGIQVDDTLRTSQGHIYAAGDCTGGPQFTHYAAWQAGLAARNALLPGASAAVAEAVPWTTFTDPEVARAGLSEARARQKFGDDVTTTQWPMDRVDRARTEGNTAGFIKLVHRQNGRLLGATIVAARAGEMIHEWIVALQHGLSVDHLSAALHVYPTYAVANMEAALSVRLERLLSGLSGRALRTLARMGR
jgi:pyruvate/2-oxoglutarate dehydrogenase complex dihydrolipoamide dehydrogenase (E3) component